MNIEFQRNDHKLLLQDVRSHTDTAVLSTMIYVDPFLLPAFINHTDTHFALLTCVCVCVLRPFVNDSHTHADTDTFD